MFVFLTDKSGLVSGLEKFCEGKLCVFILSDAGEMRKRKEFTVLHYDEVFRGLRPYEEYAQEGG